MSDLWTPLAYGAIIAVCFPLGAFLAVRARLSHHAIAAFMSLGAGLLIAAASIDLTLNALDHAGPTATVTILLTAAALFSTANWLVSRQGGGDRKRCGECVAQPREDESPGSGRAIALGTVLDAVPEALVLGVVLTGSGNAIALTVALALGNVAQSISSTSGLLDAGRSQRFVAMLWGGLALVVVATTLVSFAALGAVGETVRPWVEAFAAGILIAMTCEAMLPEAFHKNPPFRGLQAAIGVSVFALLHDLL